MKLLFASDLHGSAAAATAVMNRVKEENADRLILLGDLLYHGPRNPLPEGHDPMKTAAILNECPVPVLGVRGNCDAEIDQVLLQFPMMPDYMLLLTEQGTGLFITHGHLFHEQQLPPHCAGDVMIHGHTHVHGVFQAGDMTVLNPGSAAMPKENQPRSYMVYENGVFEIKSLESGSVLKRFTVPAEGADA